MRILQSIGAVLAGFVAVVILSIGADWVCETTGILPPANEIGAYTNVHWAIAAAYRTAFNVVGGYLTARLAPGNPMTHAIVLGCIGFAAALAGVVVAWNFMPESARWYPIALVVTSVPFCWLGARLYRPRAAVAAA